MFAWCLKLQPKENLERRGILHVGFGKLETVAGLKNKSGIFLRAGIIF